ncbi:ribonuclease domain-containing protein [Streptomyces sp. NPDC093225]|uniref:ribonuclease domain-containing protein n=1 Tax=Streptomyces sp. NPDC093225 TaxID=3366034 RepID=UPI0038035575
MIVRRAGAAVRRVLGVVFLCLALGVVTACGGGGSGGSATAGTRAGASPTVAPGRPTASVPPWAAGMAVVRAADLPAEARATLRLVDRGGPYPYRQDGVVFGNFERLLPARERGYYHEYTVRTPGERDRGARRIVTGRGGELYYTDDHYDSFRAVLR